MSAEWWSAACNASASRPLPQKLSENYGGYAFAITTYILAAFFSAYWLVLFIRLQRDEGRRTRELLWSKLPTFLAVVFLASVSGAITRAGWMHAAVYRFRMDYAPEAQQSILLHMGESQVYIYYRIFRAVETPFLSWAYLMVLNRLTNHAFWIMKLDQSGTHSIFGFKFSKLHLRRLYTCIMTLVALSSMVGIAASIASAKYLTDEADSLGQAAAACDASGQPTPQSSLLAAAAAASNRLAGRAFFAQSISDVVCIALITVMYVVIGPITLIILRGAREFLQSTRANMQQLSPQRSPRLTGDFGRNTSGQLQQRQPAGASVTVRGGSCAASDMVDIAIESALDQHTRYIVSYATVLAAFVIRSLFIIFVAIQAFEEGSNPSCSLCGTCQSLGTLIGTWYLYNTWFSGIAFAVTTPVAFCVSIWCMMNAKERQLLRSGVLPDSEVDKGATVLAKRLGILLLTTTPVDDGAAGASVEMPQRL